MNLISTSAKPGYPARRTRVADAGSRARSRRTTFAALGLAFLLSGCAGSGGNSPSAIAPQGRPPSTPTPVPAPAAPAVVAPLTGAAWSGDPRQAGRGSVVAVVAADGRSSPAGLASADVVWQQLDGTAGTRFLAVFQSQYPSSVSPVGDVRASDVVTLQALRPAVLFSTAYPMVEKALHSVGVVPLSPAAAGPAYAGTAVDVARAAAVGPLPATPPGLLPFAGIGEQLAATGVNPARTMAFAAPGAGTQQWQYDARTARWLTSSPLTGAVSVANVLVLNVDYRPTTRRHADGTPIMAPRVLGRGSCTAFSEGTTAPCTWVKGDASMFPSFTDVSGVPLRLQRGPTWLLLAPAGSRVTGTP